jgi:DNA-binding NarL/FixJ family response regulator
MINRINLFLIEDSEIFSVLLTQALVSVPEFNVHPYKSAEDAISDLYLKPDVVLMDYYLPGINGLEALKKIKQINPETPVILISSQENTKLSIQALNYGASNFIGKEAFSANTIKQSIVHAFRERAARRKMQNARKIKLFKIGFFLLIIIAFGIVYYNF